MCAAWVPHRWGFLLQCRRRWSLVHREGLASGFTLRSNERCGSNVLHRVEVVVGSGSPWILWHGNIFQQKRQRIFTIQPWNLLVVPILKVCQGLLRFSSKKSEWWKHFYNSPFWHTSLCPRMFAASPARNVRLGRHNTRRWQKMRAGRGVARLLHQKRQARHHQYES